MEKLAQLIEKLQIWLILVSLILGVLSLVFNFCFLFVRRNILKKVKENADKIRTLEFQMYSIEGLAEDLSQRIDGRGFMTNEMSLVDTSEAVKYNNRGIELFENKEYEQAVESFEHAIAIDNTYFLAYYNLGNAYLHLGLYEVAMQNLTKAIRINTTKPEVFYNRAMSYVALKDYASAVADLQEVLKLAPTDVQALLMLGNLYKKQDAGKAVDFFNRVIEINPFMVEGYLNRGKVYLAFKDFDAAIEDFKKVLDIDPYNEQASKQLTILKQIR